MAQKIEAKNFYRLNYYEYGKALASSYDGMRYRLERNPLEYVVFKSPEEKATGELMATVWPEPFSFENTPDEEKATAAFPISDEGLEQAVAWINEQYDADVERWQSAKMRWH